MQLHTDQLHHLPDGSYLLGGTIVVEISTEKLKPTKRILRTVPNTRFVITHAEPVGRRWRIWYRGRTATQTAIIERCETPP